MRRVIKERRMIAGPRCVDSGGMGPVSRPAPTGVREAIAHEPLHPALSGKAGATVCRPGTSGSYR